MSDHAALSTEEFRETARDWLAANFPPALRGVRPPAAGVHGAVEGSPQDHARWKQAVAAIGWGTPTWPKRFGGGGLPERLAEVLAEEMERAGAFNPVITLGLRVLGPTLLELASEEQKLQHLPPMARGEVIWCQGFSEPGAGSDLASLRTRCEDQGDHWLVNGQKIWTSYADKSDWCFCLVRTDTTRKQGGISFLLIDMKTPGIEARPIALIDGSTHFCETFFTDVKVPKENVVGEVNGGWTVAKRLLQHERDNLAKMRSSDPTGVDIFDLALRHCGAGADGRLADADLRTRLADHAMADHAYRLTVARRSEELEAGLLPSTPVSTLKNLGSQVAQERSELGMEILGLAGLGWDGEEFGREERDVTRLWLFSKCFSIYGGSQEVQSNIAATRELGLPAK